MPWIYLGNGANRLPMGWHLSEFRFIECEGLIYAVRDQLIKKEQIKKNGKNTGEEQENIVDYGIEDKRLLVTEGEFSRALKAMSREANILSEVLRSAWESGNLRSMVKTNPYRGDRRSYLDPRPHHERRTPAIA